MTLKLELGKKYINRRGEVVEIVFDWGDQYIHRYDDEQGRGYDCAGSECEGGVNDTDLVSEYVEPSAKPVETSNKTPHIHHDLIIAWAQGEAIQFLDSGHWYDDGTPDWNPKTVYRIKPENKVEQTYALITTSGALDTDKVEECNVKFTFEDGKLIKAEVL